MKIITETNGSDNPNCTIVETIKGKGSEGKYYSIVEPEVLQSITKNE